MAAFPVNLAIPLDRQFTGRGGFAALLVGTLQGAGPGVTLSGTIAVTQVDPADNLTDPFRIMRGYFPLGTSGGAIGEPPGFGNPSVIGIISQVGQVFGPVQVTDPEPLTIYHEASALSTPPIQFVITFQGQGESTSGIVDPQYPVPGAII